MKRLGKLGSFNQEVLQYLQLDHAEPIPSDKFSNNGYYKPIHEVIKEESTTTKIRHVCDCPAKSSTGYLLNDCLLPGPNLYPSITNILLGFRVHNIAFSADISKMFREIKLLPKERDDTSGNISEYRMASLTFGVRVSPYVATSVIRHHA